MDLRLVPARPDLAARHLSGTVTADRFADPVAMQVSAPVADLRRRPDRAAGPELQLLYGAGFTAYETGPNWVWGQVAACGYVGYLPREAVVEAGPDATHRITARLSHLYPRPDFKTPPRHVLPLSAAVAVTGQEDGFAQTPHGYVPLPHLAPLCPPEPDWVAVAESLIGTPYLWGGDSTLGIDCSGLVRLALHAAGHPCPRDSDQQEAMPATRLPEGTPFARGDLLFWKRHVGILRDPQTLLHANVHHMAVASEPLAEAIARIAASDTGPVTSILRLPSSDETD